MNNETSSTPIIDFDNYDPFGANGTPDQATSKSTSGLGSSPSKVSFSTVSPSSTDPLNPPEGGTDQQKAKGSIFSLELYKSFFNIEAQQVFDRALSSLKPHSNVNLEKNIQTNPDLYGPLWICVSLILTSAISHGVAQFVENAPKCVAVDTDMQRTSFVTSCVFLYAFLLPTAIWSFLKYQGSENLQTLPTYMCLYGYSMAVYIPISILWVIRLPIVMWPVMIVATALTGYSLLLSLWPSFRGLAVQKRLFVALFVLLLHAALAISLGTYAFEPTVSSAPLTPTEGIVSVAPNAVSHTSSPTTSHAPKS